MSTHLKQFPIRLLFTAGLLLTGVLMASALLLASTEKFLVPNDIALRIRLDDTLTSVDSRVGDPFSPTVVDQGEYRSTREYGHIAQINMSGRVKGHTAMLLRFDRLVMSD